MISHSRIARARAGLLMVGVALLMTAWIAGTLPFDAPDEASHYQRTLSIVNGAILGLKIPYRGIWLPPLQRTFINHDTRGVVASAQISPPGVVCFDGKPDRSGSCLEADPNGNFPPLPYLLPAAALSVSHDSGHALWLMRASMALQSLAFLLLAIALLWDGSAWSLLGLLAATTPMVLFVSSVINPSGVQVTACLAFAAAGLRIARAPGRAPPWVWAAFAISGAVGILAGPIGLELVAINLVALGGLLWRPGLRAVRAETPRRWLRIAGTTLLAAGVVAVVYERIAGFAPSFGISPLLTSLRQGIHWLPPVLHDAVGTFDSLHVHLPTTAYGIWWALVLCMVATAMVLGTRQERVFVAVLTVLALAFPVLFYAWVDRFTGYGLQGREVLPALMLIPLLSGEIIARHRAMIAQRAWSRPLLVATIALIAGFQAYAWWYDAGRAAANPHTLDFWRHAGWIPPTGWLLWILCAAFGTAAMLAFAVTEGFAGVRLRASAADLKPVDQSQARIARSPSRS